MSLWRATRTLAAWMRSATYLPLALPGLPANVPIADLEAGYAVQAGRRAINPSRSTFEATLAALRPPNPCGGPAADQTDERPRTQPDRPRTPAFAGTFTTVRRCSSHMKQSVRLVGFGSGACVSWGRVRFRGRAALFRLSLALDAFEKLGDDA